jgi:hypothetical protein
MAKTPEILYILLGGLVVVSLFAAKPLFAALSRGGSRKGESAQTVVNLTTLDLNAIKELLGTSISHLSPRDPGGWTVEGQPLSRPITAPDILDAAATLSRFRNLLAPTESLTLDTFPKGMRVLRFKPGRLLSIACKSTSGEKGCLAAFSFFHWMIFPGLAGGIIGAALIGSAHSWLGSVIGACVGLGSWARLSLTGPFIRINLQKRTCSFISVASAAFAVRASEVTLESERQDEGWVATVRIIGHAITTSAPTKKHEDAESELRPFVTALNWSLGNRVQVAEGVFIEPPKAPGGIEAGATETPSQPAADKGQGQVPRQQSGRASPALAPNQPDGRERRRRHGTLNGPQKEQLRDAIVSGFRRSDLEQFTTLELDQALDNIAPPGVPLEYAAFSLIEWAENRGMTEQLLLALREGRPRNAEIQAVTRELLPAPSLSEEELRGHRTPRVDPPQVQDA